MIDEGKDPMKIRNGFVNVTNEITARMKELLKLKTIPAVIQNEQMLKDMMNCDYLYDNFLWKKPKVFVSSFVILCSICQTSSVTSLLTFPIK